MTGIFGCEDKWRNGNLTNDMSREMLGLGQNPQAKAMGLLKSVDLLVETPG
jgi:hypothetical protein